MKKTRDSNLELLRIISIVLIIIGHVTWETNWHFSHIGIGHLNAIESLWIGGKLGVNIFALISAYFISTRTKFKVESIVRLWVEVLFYSWVILAISFIFRFHTLNAHNILKSFLPISFNGYWFITVYFFLYLIHPVLNQLIKVLDKKKYLFLLLVGFMYLFVFATFFRNNTAGSGDTWITLVYVYFLGAYIRKYDLVSYFKDKKVWLVIGIGIQLVLMVMSIIAINYVQAKGIMGFNPRHYAALIMGNSPFQLIMSTLVFLLFANIRIKHNKLINLYASATLGVYMMHTNYLAKDIIFDDIVKMQRFENSYTIILEIAVALVLYFILANIDLLRQKLFNKVEVKIVNKITKQLDRINVVFTNYVNKK